MDDPSDSFLCMNGRPSHPPQRQEMARALIGRELNERYRLIEVIGEGRMSLVFRAVQTPIERDVAVKIMRPVPANDERLRAQFVSEAQIIAELRHRNVVQLIDFGQTSDGLLYMVTELLRGSSLRDLLRTRPWREDEVTWLLTELCEALIEVHARGVVHRDLKPSNIFIEEIEARNRVKVLDFAIAKLLGQPAQTHPGFVADPPLYMSPEQACGAPADARADLYSLGVIAFESLARRPPFVGDTPEALAAQHRLHPPPSLSSIEGSAPVSPHLEHLIMRLLEKSPDRRPASASALRTLLAERQPESASSPKQPSASSPQSKTSSRRRGELSVQHWAWAVGFIAISTMLGIVYHHRTMRPFPTPFAAESTHPASPLLRGPRATNPQQQTIAVLPFDDLSPNKDQHYFVRGIAEELLTVLAKTKGLRVSSRMSSFALKDRGLTITEIAEELDVDHIIEGSVRRSGGTVRITAKLIDAAKDEHIWSESYDRPLTMRNLLAVQDEITAAIVKSMKGQLTVIPATTNRPVSLGSYELFLAAREDLRRRWPASLRTAKASFKRIIDMDPSFAPAYASLAETTLFLSVYANEDQAEARSIAKLLIDRALELDPHSPESLSALAGWHLAQAKPDTEAAIRVGRQAVQSNPSHPAGYFRLSRALWIAGEAQEALQMARAARKLDPLSEPITATLGGQLVWNNELQEALFIAGELLRLHPTGPYGHYIKAHVAIESGRYIDAFRHARDGSAGPKKFPGLETGPYIDVALANLFPFLTKGFIDLYPVIRRGDYADVKSKLTSMHWKQAAVLYYVARDFRNAEKVLEDKFFPVASEIRTVPNKVWLELFIIAEFVRRKTSGSSKLVMNALEDYFDRTAPEALDVGRVLISRAGFELLKGRREEALVWIDRFQQRGFAGDHLTYPIFDELRNTPMFAVRLDRNAALIAGYRRQVQRLTATPSTPPNTPAEARTK